MEVRASQYRLANTTPRTFVESILRFRTRFIGTLIGALLLVAAYTLLAPRQYTSEMSIVVGGHTAQETKTEQTNVTATPSLSLEDQVDSAIEILQSRAVAKQVLTQTSEISSSQTSPKVDTISQERSIENFNRHLQVNRLRRSTVLRVRYAASSPTIATESLQRLLDRLLAKAPISQAGMVASTFAAAEQDRYQRDLHKAQQDLATYRQISHIISIPDDKAALNKQVMQLKQELRETDTGIGELTERLTVGEKELQRLTERQLRELKTVPNVLAVEQLTTTLAGLRNQKTALLTKYQPTDRLVQEVDQQIVNTSEALQSASKMQSSEEITDVNPIWQQLTLGVSQNTLDRGAAQARQRSQTAYLAELQAELRQVETSGAELDGLQDKVNQAQDAYQLSTRKWNEAQRADGTNQTDPIFNVAKQPSFSAVPSSPSLVLLLVAALFVAPLSAMGIVVLSELARNTIASPSELRLVSRLPVLTINPFIQAAYLGLKPNSTSVDLTLKKERPEKARLEQFFHSIRLLSRFPLPATAATFMGRTLGGPANRGPTARSSAPLNLQHGFSP